VSYRLPAIGVEAFDETAAAFSCSIVVDIWHLVTFVRFLVVVSLPCDLLYQLNF
jgi:hypothetical protein